MNQLTPRRIVEALNKYIIGQDDAKRAVAVALRNRYRRSRLPDDIRDEVTPKNILMVGPTGVGKTEIARRLAKLVDAPFVKVEATKFTEVGYVGRDVDSIVRDLVEASIHMTKEQHGASVRDKAAASAEDRLVDLIVKPVKKASNPIDILLGNKPREPELAPEEKQRVTGKRDEVRRALKMGELEDEMVEIEVAESAPTAEIPGTGMNIGDVLGGILPKKTHLRKMSVSQARKILASEEEQAMIDMDEVHEEALRRAQQDGIVFIDEIDKVAGRGGSGHGPDVSREGVQRDILPIVEGSTVSTKYGPVKTDHMLFIAAGAFHVAKVSDLIPELQGRFPVRVELKPLTLEDYRRILTQPENALLRQYKALLSVDHVTLEFTDDAIDEIAARTFELNETSENIGARRLHTVMERLLEDIAYHAGDVGETAVAVSVDAEYVKSHMNGESAARDVRKYIL